MIAMDYSLLLDLFREPVLLLYLAAGTLAGIYVGAIPGLSGTMAISLLISVTFGWDTYASIALITGVYVGVVFGGSRSAILLNIPGAPAAVATSFDGYPLAQQGKAGKAMALATIQSVIGTLFGAAVMLFLTPQVARIALSFRSVDYLLLSFIGFMCVGSMGTKSVVKGIFAAALGVFLGSIGTDSMTAVRRFTFGSAYLNSGVNFIVALIGLFGASEALLQLENPASEGIRQAAKHTLPKLRELLIHLPLTLKSAVIGVLIGALPGAGGDIAALLAYDSARRSCKTNKVPFGKGAVEGVIAPETANNAAIGGAFIPMLTLGIPGDSVTAIFISALMLSGLRPGPEFLSSSPDIFMLLVSCLVVGAIFMLIFGLSGIKVFSMLTRLNRSVLMPLILIISAVGAYAVNGNLYDIFWMFGFGVLGWLLKKHDYPIGPVVLGIILRELMENNLRRALMLSGSAGTLFTGIFTRPISIILFVLVVATGVTQALRRRQK